MIAESVVNFLQKCPHIKGGVVSLDFLTSKPENYAVETSPASVILKTYTDGSCLKQFSFVFASRQYFGDEINAENHKFYEDLSNWFKKCTDEKNLPHLDGGKTSQSIETLNGSYVYETATNTARYQVQCRLVYFEK